MRETKYDRYNRSAKGRARRQRYEGSTVGLHRRLRDRRRKALRRLTQKGEA